MSMSVFLILRSKHCLSGESCGRILHFTESNLSVALLVEIFRDNNNRTIKFLYLWSAFYSIRGFTVILFCGDAFKLFDSSNIEDNNEAVHCIKKVQSEVTSNSCLSIHLFQLRLLP